MCKCSVSSVQLQLTACWLPKRTSSLRALSQSCCLFCSLCRWRNWRAGLQSSGEWKVTLAELLLLSASPLPSEVHLFQYCWVVLNGVPAENYSLCFFSRWSLQTCKSDIFSRENLSYPSLLPSHGTLLNYNFPPSGVWHLQVQCPVHQGSQVVTITEKEKQGWAMRLLLFLQPTWPAVCSLRGGGSWGVVWLYNGSHLIYIRGIFMS